MYIHRWKSPLGEITVASDGIAVKGLWFEGQRYFGSGLSVDDTEDDIPVFLQTDSWLAAYFSGDDPDVMPVLAPEGTEFRKQVWSYLACIPRGKCVTYGKIAQDLSQISGTKVSARAVGNAVGHNPISLMIPCHRVVGKNGSLTGYAGGLWRKKKLLELEGAVQTDNNEGPVIRVKNDNTEEEHGS